MSQEPNYKETVIQQFRTTPQIRKALRRWCVDNDISMGEVMQAAIIEYLKARGIDLETAGND